MLDTALAEKLGMARPTNIRCLIEANMEELASFGHVARGECNVPMPRGGVKKTLAYYLNRQQSLLVCILSKTEKAKEVRAEVIRRFDAYEELTTLSTPSPQTMSSLEIAELTGKEHFHVMRDIRELLETLELDASRFGGIYRDALNREKPCFHLPFDETMTLVAGYDAALRFKIVRRWRELEQAKPALPNFANPAEAARAWAAEFEQKQIAQAKVARPVPIAAVGELMCSRDQILSRFVHSAFPKVNSIRISRWPQAPHVRSGWRHLDHRH